MTFLPPPPGHDPASPPPATVAGVPDGVQLGTIGDRFIGLLLDFVILLPVAIATFVLHRHHSHVVLVERYGRMRPRRTFEVLPVWEAVLLALPTFLYVAGLIGLRGRTLGQQARRLRVVRAADAGAPGLGAAALRWAVVALPGLLVSFVVAGGPLRMLASGWTLVALAWMLWDGRRQGLHDKAAGVLVVVDPR